MSSKKRVFVASLCGHSETAPWRRPMLNRYTQAVRIAAALADECSDLELKIETWVAWIFTRPALVAVGRHATRPQPPMAVAVALVVDALLEISHRLGVVGLVIGVEAFSELGDPAGFRLELGAQLPEGRAPWGLGRWWGGDGEGDRHERETWRVPSMARGQRRRAAGQR